jgi:hypothetical protein
MLWYKKRICIPEIKEIRESILREAHDSAYSIHPRSNKMLRILFQSKLPTRVQSLPSCT